MQSELLSDVSGILVPGGFGDRGIEGKIQAIRYARENKVPFLGLCLVCSYPLWNLQEMFIGYSDAHSVELKPDTTQPGYPLNAGSGRCRTISAVH